MRKPTLHHSVGQRLKLIHYSKANSGLVKIAFLQKSQPMKMQVLNLSINVSNSLYTKYYIMFKLDMLILVTPFHYATPHHVVFLTSTTLHNLIF